MLSRPVHDPALEKEIKKFMQERGLAWPRQEFKPVVLYNKDLELAEVIVADTSYTEVQLTNTHYLAVFERNHHSRYGEEHFVGFNLWVVKGICARMGIEPVGKLSMRALLKFLLEQEEDKFVKDVITEVMLPMLEAHGLDEFELTT